MKSMLESKLTAPQHALLKAALVAQTESFGLVEAPIVEGILARRPCRRALDIGCGEGSFLLKLAARTKGTHFLGIDHSDLAIGDAAAKLRRGSARNVKLRTAFFDSGFARNKYDAILTRYTLQHCSTPAAFVAAVFDRLKRQGRFVAVESLDAYTDCHEADPVWARFRAALAAIHLRTGSNGDIGKSLGRLLSGAGFGNIVVQIVLCSPSTVGYARFRAVVTALARIAVGIFPDLFDAKLFRDVRRWLANRAQLERKDPYLSSAIANGSKP